jgi:hypothetical protein
MKMRYPLKISNDPDRAIKLFPESDMLDLNHHSEYRCGSADGLHRGEEEQTVRTMECIKLILDEVGATFT